MNISPVKLNSHTPKVSGSLVMQRRSLADLKPIRKVLPLIEPAKVPGAASTEHGNSSKSRKSPDVIGRAIRTGAFQVLNSARSVV